MVVDKQILRERIGERIRTARTNMGLTQAELVAITKLNQQTISLVECGQREPSLSIAIRLCKVLKLDMKDFWDDLEFDDK